MKRALVLGAMLTAVAWSAVAQDKLVVTAFGGVWRESIEKNFASCFKERTGKDVVIQTGESGDWLNRIKANPTNPPIHVVTLAQADTTRGLREGLFDTVTAEKAPHLKEIPDRFYKGWNGQAVDVHVGGLGVMYNKEKIKDPPKDWVALIDGIAAGKFGKKVSMPSGTYTWGPDWLWFIAQQYGGDIDVAFAKVKAMQPSVVKFWTSPVEALNLFGSKEVDLLIYWDGRAWAFIDDGNAWADFYLPAPNVLGATVGFSKVKGAPDYAWTYIDCAMTPSVQLAHLKTLRYAVTNPLVMPPDDIKAKISPVDKMVWPNYPEYIDKFPGWIERWNKEMR